MKNHMKRITRDALYVGMAAMVAHRGTCVRATVGAVIVVDNHPISLGYNGAPAGMPHCTDVGCDIEDGGCVRAIHAEANAIAWAASRGLPTAGGTMYCTHAPCRPCAQLMVAAGLSHLHYQNDYRKARLDIISDGGLTITKHHELEGLFDV